MQRRVFNCATIRVANTTDISGTATAKEIKRGLWTGKGRSLWRIACSIIRGCLIAVGLLVAVAPLPARADNDKDKHPGREDNDKGIRAEITALQATVSALQDQVNTLQTANVDLQNEVTALQNQLANAKNVLALDPFVSVDPNPEIGVNGPNITFTGANIHIVSGSQSTFDNGNARGLGNLIIGYDEDPIVVSPFGPQLLPGERGGSHNLVIGGANRFTKAAFGGIVAGELNTISNGAASVLGGQSNTASGFSASVSGGLDNTASGEGASVSGGQGNTASGFSASVSGGATNTASGTAASVSGGNTNTAGGNSTVVIGGLSVTDNTNFSIAPQPPFP
jgi:hypothetical protein